MKKISIIIASLIAIFLYTAEKTSSQDLYCKNTFSKIKNKIDSQSKSYSDKGFSVPPNIGIAQISLNNIGNLAYTVSINYIQSKQGGISILAVDGPASDYTDYIQLCRNEVLSEYCPGGFVNNGYMVECKKDSSNLTESNTQMKNGSTIGKGNYYKDKNGIWRNN